jgi:hypothetical protein
VDYATFGWTCALLRRTIAKENRMAAHRCTAFGLGLVTLFGASRAASDPPEGARARSVKATLSAGCRVQGSATPRANAPIEDAQGRLLARFSGAPTLLVADSFPSRPGGRVRVTTGTGKGSFRVQGFTPVHEIPLYSTAPIAVSPGHVWIAAGKSLAYLSSGRNAIRIEKRVAVPFDQSFRAWAPCASIAFEPPALPSFTPEGIAQNYVIRRSRLELLGDPRRPDARVLTLVSSPQPPQALFFGREERGEWVRVEHQGELIIDAWARAVDLEALPRGQGLDQLAPQSSLPFSARLAVQGEPRVVRASREIPFRARADDSEMPLGVIEAEAEAFVLDVVAGWVSVMPKALQVVPRPDGQFWVRAEELGM